MIIFLTALAGGFGGASRFLVDTGVSRINRISAPLGTVVVNATACLILGIITGYATTHLGSDDLRSIFGVGLIGGYSTFSTASIEGFRLIRQRRWVVAALHSGGMLALSIVASVLGLLLGAATS